MDMSALENWLWDAACSARISLANPLFSVSELLIILLSLINGFEG